MPLIDVPTVHAVTNARILTDPAFKSLAHIIFDALGAAGAVHLRGPGLSVSTLFRLAEQLSPLQSATGCRLVINDRPDVAAATGAWGAQLTQRSLFAADARRAFPGLKLGVSVHSLTEAHAAIASGDDWLLAGNVYETETHPGRAGQGVEFIAEIAALGSPVIAIGGITPDHVATLRAHGAAGVAAISGIWDKASPASTAVRYL